MNTTVSETDIIDFIDNLSCTREIKSKTGGSHKKIKMKIQKLKQKGGGKILNIIKNALGFKVCKITQAPTPTTIRQNPYIASTVNYANYVNAPLYNQWMVINEYEQGQQQYQTYVRTNPQPVRVTQNNPAVFHYSQDYPGYISRTQDYQQQYQAYYDELIKVQNDLERLQKNVNVYQQGVAQTKNKLQQPPITLSEKSIHQVNQPQNAALIASLPDDILRMITTNIKDMHMKSKSKTMLDDYLTDIANLMITYKNMKTVQDIAGQDKLDMYLYQVIKYLVLSANYYFYSGVTYNTTLYYTVNGILKEISIISTATQWGGDRKMTINLPNKKQIKISKEDNNFELIEYDFRKSDVERENQVATIFENIKSELKSELKDAEFFAISGDFMMNALTDFISPSIADTFCKHDNTDCRSVMDEYRSQKENLIALKKDKYKKDLFENVTSTLEISFSEILRAIDEIITYCKYLETVKTAQTNVGNVVQRANSTVSTRSNTSSRSNGSSNQNSEPENPFTNLLIRHLQVILNSYYNYKKSLFDIGIFNPNNELDQANLITAFDNVNKEYKEIFSNVFSKPFELTAKQSKVEQLITNLMMLCKSLYDTEKSFINKILLESVYEMINDQQTVFKYETHYSDDVIQFTFNPSIKNIEEYKNYVIIHESRSRHPSTTQSHYEYTLPSAYTDTTLGYYSLSNIKERGLFNYHKLIETLRCIKEFFLSKKIQTNEMYGQQFQTFTKTRQDLTVAIVKIKLQSGGKMKVKKVPKKTDQKVIYNGRERILYLGTHGGKYIKTKGEYVLIKAKRK